MDLGKLLILMNAKILWIMKPLPVVAQLHILTHAYCIRIVAKVCRIVIRLTRNVFERSRYS